MLNYLSTKYIVVVPGSMDKLTRLEIIYFYSFFEKGGEGDFKLD